eukprot:3218208-Amphidinium_carterae.1
MRAVLLWAVEQETEIWEADVNQRFGAAAPAADQAEMSLKITHSRKTRLTPLLVPMGTVHGVRCAPSLQQLPTSFLGTSFMPHTTHILWPSNLSCLKAEVAKPVSTSDWAGCLLSLDKWFGEGRDCQAVATPSECESAADFSACRFRLRPTMWSPSQIAH